MQQHARTAREQGGSATVGDNDDGESPWVVVHCSAGCGRTGTFCTVDSVIHLLEKQSNQASAAADDRSTRPNDNNSVDDKGQKISPFHLAQSGGDAFVSPKISFSTVHNFGASD